MYTSRAHPTHPRLPRPAPLLQLSPECKDLLNKIFVIDAKKRISIEQIEKHPWCAAPSALGGRGMHAPAGCIL